MYVPGGSVLYTVSIGPFTFCLPVGGRWEVPGDQRAGGMRASYLFPFSFPARLLQIVCMPLPMTLIPVWRPSSYSYSCEVSVPLLSLSGLDVSGSGAIHYPLLVSLNLSHTFVHSLLNSSQVTQVVDANLFSAGILIVRVPEQAL